MKYTNNKEKAYIITSDLKPIIRKKVGEKINIGEIKPDTLYFDLINVKEKKVPIDISNISYKLIDGQKITKTIITPDSVTIIGQKSYVNNIDKIDVVPQNIGLLKNQKKYDFNLDIPDGISSSHNIASVSHEIEMYTKASKRIKIKAINIPADCTCTIIPQYVTVNYIVPISYYNNVTESNFTATVNYKNAKENTIEIKVQSDNGRIKIQRIIPETCSFILERK